MLFESEIITLFHFPVQQLSSIVGCLHAQTLCKDELPLRRNRERDVFSVFLELSRYTLEILNFKSDRISHS